MTVAELRREILGFTWSPAPGGAPGVLVGSGPPRTGPNIVLAPTEDGYTLMALSSKLEVGELLAITSDARPVCEQDWVGAGGIILDCVPTEPDCLAGR